MQVVSSQRSSGGGGFKGPNSAPAVTAPSGGICDDKEALKFVCNKMEYAPLAKALLFRMVTGLNIEGVPVETKTFQVVNATSGNKYAEIKLRLPINYSDVFKELNNRSDLKGRELYVISMTHNKKEYFLSRDGLFLYIHKDNIATLNPEEIPRDFELKIQHEKPYPRTREDLEYDRFTCSTSNKKMKRITSIVPFEALGREFRRFNGNICTRLKPHLIHLNGEFRTVKITGKLTNNLGSRIRSLDLGNNLLTGQIPTLNALFLCHIDLSNNQFTGPIPKFGPALKILNLNTNQLTGPVPSFEDNPNLNSLCLDTNQLTGTIPTKLGSLHQLRYLYLNDNQLTGTIPESLTALNLHTCCVQHNELSGLIPSGFSAENFNYDAEKLRPDPGSI